MSENENIRLLWVEGFLMTLRGWLFGLFCMLFSSLACVPVQAIDGWPDKIIEIEYLSRADNSNQPALF